MYNVFPVKVLPLVLFTAIHTTSGIAVESISVSDNGRFLVDGSGEPYFYLGDTAWEIFHRLKREEVDLYLANRVEKGFNVIQVVLLAEEDGLRVPNAYGHLPLIDEDPARPLTIDGPENDYWDHVDYVFERADALGLTLAVLPTWGDKWNQKWGIGPVVFNKQNAFIYGRWLGERYGDRHLIWVLGGDRPIEAEVHRKVVSALARGIEETNGKSNLMTYHPSGGGRSSTEWFHEAAWLDFNMMQTGPNFERPDGRYFPNYLTIEGDYGLEPRKPCMDAEPGYENAAPQRGLYDAACVRRWSYWSVFAGGFGISYGAAEVWQFSVPGVRGKRNGSENHWLQALDYPGAHQMVHLKNLMLSRPYLERVPDQTLIAGDVGEGIHHVRATRGEGYAMVYVPTGRSVILNMGKITGDSVRAWWFDPKTGQANNLGVFENKGEVRFTPPGLILDGRDVVLILDDVSEDFRVPGQP